MSGPLISKKPNSKAAEHIKRPGEGIRTEECENDKPEDATRKEEPNSDDERSTEIQKLSEDSDERKKEEDEEEDDDSKDENKKSCFQATKDKISSFLYAIGFISLIQDNSITLKNTVIGLVSYGLQRLITSRVFDCPLKNHQLYGNCFLYVPAGLLFCVNVLIIGQVWQISGRCFVGRYRRRGEVIGRLIPFGLMKALVGPAVWLIACFANGNYYICATVGSDAVKRNLKDPREIEALKEEIDAARALSHILSWAVAGTLTILGTVVIIVKKCFLKDHLLLNNLYMYERREATGAMYAFEKLMRGEDINKVTEEEKEKRTHNFGDNDDFYFFVFGIPEVAGRETTRKIFEEEGLNYIQAYDKFCRYYPRVASGNPADSWRALRGDHSDGRPQRRLECCCPTFRQKSDSEDLEHMELEHLMSTAAPAVKEGPLDYP